MKVVIVSCLLAMLMAVVSAQPNLNGGVAVDVNATQFAQNIAAAFATLFKLPSTAFSCIVPILTSVPIFTLQIASSFLSIVTAAPATCAPCTPGGVCIQGCASLNFNG